MPRRKTERPDRADLRAGSTDYIAKVLETADRLWRLSKAAGPPGRFRSFNDGTYEGGFTLASRPSGRNRHGRPFQRSNGRAIVPLSPDIEPNNPFSIELWGQ